MFTLSHQHTVNLLHILPWLKQTRSAWSEFLIETGAFRVHLFAAHPSFANNTFHGLALVRAAFIAEKHSTWLNLSTVRTDWKKIGCVSTYEECALVVKYSNVSVETDTQITFPVFKTHLLGGVLAAPSHNVFNCHATVLTLRPQDAKTETNTANASPRLEEVALLEACLRAWQ